MSKWIDNFKASYEKKIRDRIQKLEDERHYYDREYRDRPWDIFEKAMDNRSAEIGELEELLKGDQLRRDLNDYKETCQALKLKLAQINYLADTIEPSYEIGENNRRKIISMTNPFTDQYIGEDFKAHANKGMW